MQLPYNSGEIPKYWLIGRFQECLQQLMFQLPLSYSSHRIAQSHSTFHLWTSTCESNSKEALTDYYVTIHHFFVGAILERDLNFMTFVKWQQTRATPACFESWSSLRSSWRWRIRTLHFSLFLCRSISKWEKWKRRKTQSFAKKTRPRDPWKQKRPPSKRELNDKGSDSNFV